MGLQSPLMAGVVSSLPIYNAMGLQKQTLHLPNTIRFCGKFLDTYIRLPDEWFFSSSICVC